MNIPALVASAAFAGMSLFSSMQPSLQETSQQLEQQVLDRQGEVWYTEVSAKQKGVAAGAAE